MKSKLLKGLLILVVLVGSLVGVWYFYFYKNYLLLNSEDRTIIMNELKPDSEGRGYSDAGKKLIEHDMSIIKNEKVTTEELQYLVFFYDLSFKSYRKTLLSENKEEFLKNFLILRRANSCVSYILTSGKISTEAYYKLENFFFYGESRKTSEYFDILIKKNFRFLSIKERFDVFNERMSEQECLITYKKARLYEL